MSEDRSVQLCLQSGPAGVHFTCNCLPFYPRAASDIVGSRRKSWFPACTQLLAFLVWRHVPPFLCAVAYSRTNAGRMQEDAGQVISQPIPFASSPQQHRPYTPSRDQDRAPMHRIVAR